MNTFDLACTAHCKPGFGISPPQENNTCHQQVKEIFEKQYEHLYNPYCDDYHPPRPDEDEDEDEESIYNIFSLLKRLCADTTAERPDPFEAYLAVEPIARVKGERFDLIA